MKYFSFKIIIAFLFAPPVLYLLGMYFLGSYLDKKYRTEIEEIYIGDTAPLFDGSLTLKKALNSNIDAYIEKDFFIAIGVDTSVTVFTSQGMLLYPDTNPERNDRSLLDNPVEIAAENYALLNEGLYLRVNTRLSQNSLPANILLAFFIVTAALFLYAYYRAGIRRALHDSAETERELKRFLGKEQAYGEQLDSLVKERIALTLKFTETKKKLEKERAKSEQNEGDLIEEIVTLEKDLSDNLDAQEEQQVLIDELKERVTGLEKLKAAGTGEQKADINIQKRFETLYKNTLFTKKAISGYSRLPTDLKLKGEELIHQLNAHATQVRIKRKVFGKKNRETVFEVIFGYKGRLYFRRLKDTRTEVLSIGTKNTQRKDLEFLDKL